MATRRAIRICSCSVRPRSRRPPRRARRTPRCCATWTRMATRPSARGRSLRPREPRAPSGSGVCYPPVAECRDRGVHLPRDHSRLLATFPDAEHLRIEGIEPAHAVRRGSRVRVGSETVAMPLNPVGDGTPQVLKVQYAYYRGVFAWRPVLISLGLLILGNLTGLWMISGEVSSLMRARLRLGRGARDAEPIAITPERLAAIRPGESTYEDVVRVCGLPDEQHRRVAAGQRRTLVYRATQRRPERGVSVGWLTT